MKTTDRKSNPQFILIMPILLVSLAALFLGSCTDTGGDLGSGPAKVQKYYSAEEPGRWGPQAVDHDIKVSIIVDAKGRKGIEVSVPFTYEMSEQHYVEAIALLDQDNRQLDSVRFKRGEKAVTIFPITDKINFPVYVVAKCNMHDMWRIKVTGKEKGKEGE
jgi:desulfoferrodoxin (superoxide reductase-like protein)